MAVLGRTVVMVFCKCINQSNKMKLQYYYTYNTNNTILFLLNSKTTLVLLLNGLGHIYEYDIKQVCCSCFKACITIKYSSNKIE